MLGVWALGPSRPDPSVGYPKLRRYKVVSTGSFALPAYALYISMNARRHLWAAGKVKCPNPIKESHGFEQIFGSFVRGNAIEPVLSPCDGSFECFAIRNRTARKIGKGRRRRTRGVTRLMRTGSGQSSGSCQANLILCCRIHRVTTFFYTFSISCATSFFKNLVFDWCVRLGWEPCQTTHRPSCRSSNC